MWQRRVAGGWLLVAALAGCGSGSDSAPRAAPTGCAALAREFATGGGREAAAGIDYLPADALERFIERFDAVFPGR